MEQDIKKEDLNDHLKILMALNEIPFLVGKTLLIDFLIGSMKNKSILKNNLFNKYNFGCFKNKSEGYIREVIENLISNKLIEPSTLPNSFIKVISITSKGCEELLSPTLNSKKIKNKYNLNISEVSEQDEILFNELSTILEGYNPWQKKAIISQKDKILCIAGAGSGKTAVLVKRIEFLIKYRSVPENKILAITFTRKAKQEMESRLLDLGIRTNIETFNSFCEQILRKYSHKVYHRNVRIMTYSDKLLAVSLALSKSGLDINRAVDIYFSENQKRGKELDKLANIFLGDCFSIIEYFKTKKQDLYDFSRDMQKDQENAKVIYSICKDIMTHMQVQGLRDFTDQILDCLKFFQDNPLEIPEFQHVLVDEYQDVNDAQIKLLSLLDSKNLFCVGDPRQSIFGWRGSNINYILDFQKEYPGAEIIGLKKNYRSARKILEFMNLSISDLGLEDLEGHINDDGELFFVDFETEQEEYEYIIQRIKLLNLERNEIFILARTNRQLNELSKKFLTLQIPHIVKSDEIMRPVEAKKGEIVLSTIHAIKGLEAKAVFLIGCNEQNFPCKASDHPILEFIKGQESDKEEEEKRLFYVAISRAKEKLFLSYSGKKPTYFINEGMKKIIQGAKFQNIFD
jgi:superfamily I DNA/RNA helicase